MLSEVGSILPMESFSKFIKNGEIKKKRNIEVYYGKKNSNLW